MVGLILLWRLISFFERVLLQGGGNVWAARKTPDPWQNLYLTLKIVFLDFHSYENSTENQELITWSKTISWEILWTFFYTGDWHLFYILQCVILMIIILQNGMTHNLVFQDLCPIDYLMLVPSVLTPKNVSICWMSCHIFSFSSETSHSNDFYLDGL